jgi:hypothetical protein
VTLGPEWLNIMMANIIVEGDWMPGKRADRIVMAGKMLSWLADHAVAYGIPVAIVEQLTDDFTAMQEAQATETAVNSSHNVALAKKADKTMQATMRELYTILMTCNLSDSDKEAMDIRRWPKFTDGIPRAINQGKITGYTMKGPNMLYVLLGIIGALPAGHKKSWYKFKIRFGIVYTGHGGESASNGDRYIDAEPATYHDLPGEHVYRGKRWLKAFSPEDRTKKVFFSVCLINEKQEEGPYGPIYWTYVP